MRYTQLFGKTLREVPQDVRVRSLELLLRGGYVRPLGHGLYSFLPLGFRVMRNVCRIVREEMEAIGGQEVLLPLVNPSELWERTGRSVLLGRDLVRFPDRSGRELVLAASHEEGMVELVRSAVQSYRELPLFLFQFQEKFRDEERTHAGLMRTKEFIMKDAYSFHRSSTDLNNFFPKVFAAYERIFARCGIAFVTVEAGVGYMAGERAYEFQMPSSAGQAVVVSCPKCGYRANREVAKGKKQPLAHDPPAGPARPPLERVETPGCETIEGVARCLTVERRRIAKSLVYRMNEGFVMAVVRGDYEVSPEKLATVMKQPVAGLAEPEELAELGLLPGYLSPIGLDGCLPVVVDDLVAGEPNLVFGANEEGWHLLNGNFGRDYESELVGDIAAINPGDACIQCGAPLEEYRSVELGHLFKLGSFYSRAMDLTFQEEDGEKVFPHMGAYGIGIGRLIAAAVEANNDKNGITWPGELAPFRAYLMSIGKSLPVAEAAKEIHASAEADILFDDRPESPGVKFQDADLLGLPLRIVVSPKHLAERRVEVRRRRDGAIRLVPLNEISRELAELDGREAPHAL